MHAPPLQHHFQDMEKQRHAAKLGTWIFLSSELLFFNALFAIYAFYRVKYPEMFQVGVSHNMKWMGSINTAILILGSVSIASAVNFLRLARRRLAILLTLFTCLCGLGYITIKSIEYGFHFDEGIYPGAAGHFFVEHPEHGLKVFFTTYYLLTGLHMIHVAVAVAILGWMAWWVHRDRIGPWGAYRLGLVALYWHFVDTIWLFLWPMFYLMGERT